MESNRTTKKPITLRKTLNPSTGKFSSKDSAFNDRNWGAKTRGYTKASQGLSPETFKDIINMTFAYIKTPSGGQSGMSCLATSIDEANAMDIEEDLRAQLVYIPDNCAFYDLSFHQ